MKKNKMMRIAAILLIVTLLSTCAISGTFAKYITKGEGSGNARVAAWGIEISMEDNLFATQYETDDADYEGEYSVVSANGDELVAPGTKKDDAITATISGTPEVATRLYLKLDVESDAFLEAGDYLDYTTGLIDDDEFTLTDDYYPVKFNIAFQGTIANHRNMSFKLSDIAGFAGLDVSEDGVSLTELTDWLEANEGYYPVIGNTNAFGLGIDEQGRIYVDVPAGKTIDGTFTLSWAWAFEQEPMDDPMDNSSMYDKADTYLGMTQPNIDFTFAAAAVQID
ncbi:MAG: hypothetical protein IJG87_04370 [Ruminococcus sp.]|nr:hypothetical protein [Ruminococcus sp.]